MSNPPSPSSTFLHLHVWTSCQLTDSLQLLGRVFIYEPKVRQTRSFGDEEEEEEKGEEKGEEEEASSVIGYSSQDMIIL